MEDVEDDLKEILQQNGNENCAPNATQRKIEAVHRRVQIRLPSHLWIPLLMLLVSTSPHSCTAFVPQSKVQLKSAVHACLKQSPKCDCCNGPHGPIGDWDVSNVADMSRMFSYAPLFNGDLSKWDVSSVKDMSSMFLAAKSFNRDLSKWDVSSVSTMPAMFRWAASFNGDVSKWDVSSVGNMDYMFWDATLFKRKLCGAAWVHSKARKTVMFAGSSGSISETVCATTPAVFSPQSKTTPAVFSPQSKVELKNAVDEYLKLCSQGDCSDGPHGPIEEWDVSSVTDMSRMFLGATSLSVDISKWDVSRVADMNRMFSNTNLFNGDLSKWDVSSVTDMTHMFYSAEAFNGDLSKWDVSSVKHMDAMFYAAESFKQQICGDAWVHSKASKQVMFEESSGSISPALCSSTPSVFSPQSKAELQEAVYKFIKLCPEGDCSDGPNGPIAEWDVSRITDMSNMFMTRKFFNGDISEWDVSRVTDMSRMFYRTRSFNGDLSKWDVSSVRDMNSMFFHAAAFDGDISKWDVSRVKDMTGMFLKAAFKQKICGAAWVHSKAKKIGMFKGSFGLISRTTCTTVRFRPENRQELKTAVGAYLKMCPQGDCSDGRHGLIGEWDVSRVTTMRTMFKDKKEFNGDISKWDVSRCIGMSQMFDDANLFNGDLSKWDVSRVEDMMGMFTNAAAFNGDLSKWDVSRVEEMGDMFVNVGKFNSDLSKWDVSSVVDMKDMFNNAQSFTQKLYGVTWVHSKASKETMFKESPGSIATAAVFRPKSKEELKSAVDLYLELCPEGGCPTGPHGPINEWDVSDVTDMSRMFRGAESFNGDISKWDMSRVTITSRMFYNAKLFNSDLSKWDMSSVKDMTGMFINAEAFNGDISKWDVSSVKDMKTMFNNAVSFKQNICGATWVHSKASKSKMFAGSPGSIGETVCATTPTPAASSVFCPKSKEELKRAVDEYLKLPPQGDGSNGPHGAIGEWDVSHVTDMSRMFLGAISFNGDISKWDVSRVTDMSHMFYSAQSFNGDLSKWDVSRVTDMTHMFDNAVAFNGDLSEWDVSIVKDMNSMFSFAAAFNGDISKWDVSRVTIMIRMFYNAKLFNEDLSNWDVSSVQEMTGMFINAAAFNRDLSKWDVSSVKDMKAMFFDAVSFKQNICGASWVHSKANKDLMFKGSSGSIAETTCATTVAVLSVFYPKSRAELKGAVDAYLKLSPQGDDSNGLYGPIGEWDVSRVTDMSRMFRDAKSFNGDISKWDVSRVTDMSHMFVSAQSFNGDLSKWDVSRVTDMNHMFDNAVAFNGDLSEWDVSSVKDMDDMFSHAAAFNRDLSKWDVSSVKHMNAMFSNAAAFKQELCGDAWVQSKASKMGMFAGTSRSPLPTECTSAPTPFHFTEVTGHQVTRRPLPERELIVRTRISTSFSTSAFTSTILSRITCPKCGTFAKSGRVSCCAPGGAWYKNCGVAANKNLDHKWLEGTEACKPRTTTTVSSVCPKCGTTAKSGKMSCCGRGGSWFKACGGSGKVRLQHTWYEGIQSCKAQTQSRIAVGQQENAVEQKGIDSSHGADKVNSKGVITAAKSFSFSSANMSTSMAVMRSVIGTASKPSDPSVRTSPAYATNSKVIGVATTIISMPVSMSIPTPSISSGNMSTPTPIITSHSTSVTEHGCVKMNIALHISLLITIIL